MLGLLFSFSDGISYLQGWRQDLLLLLKGREKLASPVTHIFDPKIIQILLGNGHEIFRIILLTVFLVFL